MNDLTPRNGALAWSLWILFASTLTSRADLEWRISAKYFVASGADLTPAIREEVHSKLTSWVERANEIHARMGRGYQFRVVEVVPLTNAVWTVEDVDGTTRDRLEAEALADPIAFHWSTNAINLYLNQGGGAFVGFCARPENGNAILMRLVGPDSVTMAHELGHYLGLRHTFQGENECSSCSSCDIRPGNADRMDDTLADHACWGAWPLADTQDSMSRNSFGQDYADLTESQRVLVDNTVFNVMSYRGSIRDLFTPDQLDRMTDVSAIERRHVVTGRTWFVDEASICVIAGGNSTCELNGPFQTVRQAVLHAEEGDIVLIRKGRYPESLTLSKPLVLRASRGSAELGHR